MMKKLPIIAASILFLPALGVHAQDANTQRALQKAQFMLRQAASEKSELETQVGALKQQVEQLSKEIASTKASAASTQQRTEEKYGSAIALWKQHDGELKDELENTKEQLKQTAKKQTELEAELAKQKNNFSICYENNKKLYDINGKLLNRYENKGLGDVLEQKEPFTGIKQVEIENLVQDYRYQLDDLRVQAEPAAASDKTATE